MLLQQLKYVKLEVIDVILRENEPPFRKTLNLIYLFGRLKSGSHLS